MEDHPSDSDNLVEEREEFMVPPSGGNPISIKAHFLKPIFSEYNLHLFPPPNSLLSSKPTSEKLEKCTLQSYKGLPSEKWKFWVQSLKPIYQDIWKETGIYEAILASTYAFPKDKMLIFGLAERWCADTNTFMFPWCEVTITLEDVIYLGCHSVLGASFSTRLDHESIDIFKCMKNDHKKVRLGHGGNVSASSWMDYFMCSGKQLEHEAFLALWLSRFVLVRPQNYVGIQDFRVAIHLSRGKRIALAPVVLACIYRDMRLLHNTIVDSIKLESIVGLRFISCHYDLVQMWVWERFTELRPVPNVIGRGEPRSARWNGVTNLKVYDVRTALDSAGLLFLWRPYAIISSNSMLSNLYKEDEQWVVVESDAVESFARCLRASELVGLGYTEQYMPHRVAMQFGLDQDLPPHVVRSNGSPETAWSSYNRPIRGVKLYIPPRLFDSGVSSRYVVWYRSLVMVNDSIQNEKHLPLVSWGHKRDAKSLATPGSLSGCIEEKAVDDKLVLNGTPSLLAEASKKSKCTSEPVERGMQNMYFSYKCKKSKLSTEKQTEPKEYAVVNRNLKFTNEPVEMSSHCMSSNRCKKGKFSTERQTKPEEDAFVSPEDNIVHVEEESYDGTASEIQDLGLEARIWRLERILDEIKAAKFCASSRANLDK